MNFECPCVLSILGFWSFREKSFSFFYLNLTCLIFSDEYTSGLSYLSWGLWAYTKKNFAILNLNLALVGF